MKIIFLDHDGVICLPHQHGSRFKKQKALHLSVSLPLSSVPLSARFDNFDPKAIKVLNQILKKTEAEIVVTSDWRQHASLEELKEYYTLQGIIKTPLDSTEFFSPSWKSPELKLIPPDFPWDRNQDIEQQRYFEILKYLKDHPQITHWVAIDDLIMGKYIYTYYSGNTPLERDWGLSNFIHSNYWEGIKKTGAANKIINFLK